MGRLFLGLICTPAIALAQISLPENPKNSAPIPHRSDAAVQKDQEANSEQRLKMFEEAGMVKKEDTTPPELKRDQQLLEQSLKPIPLDFLWYAHLNYTTISTSGGEREDYTTDPSVGTSFLYRISQKSQPNSLNTWGGFRSHFFSGTGRQKDISGHYSFSYFGPTLGIGTISLGQGDVDKDAFSSSSNIAKALTMRHGFFALAGLAAVSIEGNHEAMVGEDEPEDFSSTSVGFDSPGIFAELLYTAIHYNALSYNAIGGVQMGKGKMFTYFGFGLGVWM